MQKSRGKATPGRLKEQCRQGMHVSGTMQANLDSRSATGIKVNSAFRTQLSRLYTV